MNKRGFDGGFQGQGRGGSMGGGMGRGGGGMMGGGFGFGGGMGGGFNKRPRYEPSEHQMKFLIHNRQVGAVIGKGGENIKRIRTIVPNAKVAIQGKATWLASWFCVY